MKVYAHVNNCVIKEDKNNRFWVFDRNEELISANNFEFAADAISFAHDNQNGLLND